MIGSSIIQRLSTGTYKPAKWFVDWATGGPVASGVTVNENTALNYSAVWAATRILSETVASLPLPVYLRLFGNRGKARAPDHPLYDILHDAPNGDMDSFTFRETMASFHVNWGNAFSEIVRTRGDTIVALLPLHSQAVRPERLADKSIVFYVRQDNGTERGIMARNMFHLTGPLSEDGIMGKGVIRRARESIGMGLATEKYGAAFFGSGARPSGVLEHPGNPSPEAAERMRKSWQDMHGGVENAQRVAFLREGTKWSQIGIPPEDAQFLQTRQHNITEIARWYRLPPHVLADLSNATYSNIEHEGIHFVIHSILPWLIRWERAIKRQLISPIDTQHFAEFLVDALLRGDSAARTTSLTQQFLNGAITLNEWRAIENRNALDGEGGDVHFVPLNLKPIDKVLEDEPEPEPVPPPLLLPEPEKDEGEPEEEGGVEKNQAAIDASRAALLDTIYRMQQKEINAVRRAAKTPDAFLAKVDKFYGKHVDTFREAIMPTMTAYVAAQWRGPPPPEIVENAAGTLTARHIDAAKTGLLTACECQPSELADAVEALTKTWTPKLYTEVDNA